VPWYDLGRQYCRQRCHNLRRREGLVVLTASMRGESKRIGLREVLWVTVHTDNTNDCHHDLIRLV